MRRSLAVAATAVSAAALAVPSAAQAERELVLTVLDPGSGSTQVARVPAGGGTPELVTPASQEVWSACASWWNTRNRVLYSQQNRAEQEPSYLGSSTLSGGSARTMPNSTGAYCGSTSAKGKRVAFVGNQGNNTVIGVMSPKGANKRVLVKSSTVGFYLPRLSPDGKTVAYNKVTYKPNAGGTQTSDIVLVDVASGKRTNITADRDKFFSEPAWVDGDSLLAVRGTSRIVTITSDGSKVKAITKGGGTYAASPVVSPNGKKVAYLTCQGDCGDPQLSGTGTLWTVKVDGSDKKQVLAHDQTGPQPNGTVDWVRQ